MSSVCSNLGAHEPRLHHGLVVRELVGEMPDHPVEARAETRREIEEHRELERPFDRLKDHVAQEPLERFALDLEHELPAIGIPGRRHRVGRRDDRGDTRPQMELMPGSTQRGAARERNVHQIKGLELPRMDVDLRPVLQGVQRGVEQRAVANSARPRRRGGPA